MGSRESAARCSDRIDVTSDGVSYAIGWPPPVAPWASMQIRFRATGGAVRGQAVPSPKRCRNSRDSEAALEQAAEMVGVVEAPRITDLGDRHAGNVRALTIRMGVGGRGHMPKRPPPTTSRIIVRDSPRQPIPISRCSASWKWVISASSAASPSRAAQALMISRCSRIVLIASGRVVSQSSRTKVT